MTEATLELGAFNRSRNLYAVCCVVVVWPGVVQALVMICQRPVSSGWKFMNGSRSLRTSAGP
jgi:hypothetical protein